MAGVGVRVHCAGVSRRLLTAAPSGIAPPGNIQSLPQQVGEQGTRVWPTDQEALFGSNKYERSIHTTWVGRALLSQATGRPTTGRGGVVGAQKSLSQFRRLDVQGVRGAGFF